MKTIRLQWRGLWQSLRDRFVADRLSLVAGSLTFTTIMAIVPLFTVALAIFTTHPVFFDLQKVLQKWLIDSLVPDTIERQVMGSITQFTAKANRLGFVGFLALLGSALALIFTIERTMNNIWRVRARRAVWQRLLLYSALLVFGPMLLAASLWLTTFIAVWSKSLVGTGSVRLFYSGLEFALVWIGLTGLYRFAPSAPVLTRHALIGGFFAAALLESAKKILTIYLIKIPTYSLIYGAFATVPVLLIWIYVAWLVVLVGAEVAASLAELRTD